MPPRPVNRSASLPPPRRRLWRTGGGRGPSCRASRISTLGMLTNAATPLSAIASTPVERISTGMPFLDWCFGSTATLDSRLSWGLPAGGLTLLSGSGGCGKSRLAIAVAASLSRGYQHVLYSQSEVSLPQFKLWVAGQQAHEDNFLVAACEDAEALTAMILDLKPFLVVVDSISMLAGIERQSRARQIVMSLKRAVEEVGAHGLLLAHENARKQVKGGTLLPHMVDVVARMERSSFPDSWVTITVGKNRFGPSGRSATFNHEPQGLVPVFVSDAVHPMMQVRFDPTNGEERRRVPVYGSGGKTLETDADGRPIAPPRGGFLRRIASLL
jgi:predicted ATP-dependent serine protease